ncbi:hypothetical protein LEP1GSC124_3061 [Leptospira interrogans serovar Pyrogenes str. 200701872]|uniref:Glycosyltransferase, group 1 domain protein n=1 Tax=Leptospira interrogans serovar Pyrogenes str. 200701872 TaxID=1193029 RepID=M6ZFJ8_LEPIR|nr:hypothetical protein LEP1GSC124_3061 [Leptospira interrogans serovar Pyrogenes str. 200701872]
MFLFNQLFPFGKFFHCSYGSLVKRKPVLVNARSDVLKGHCLRSNGGLFYSDRKSFFAALNFILDHPIESIEMGKNGKKYVEQNFNPKIVKDKLLRLIEKTIQKNILVRNTSYNFKTSTQLSSLGKQTIPDVL